jgi:hypothetical protein
MAEIKVSVPDEYLDALKKKLGTTKSTEVIQEALALLNWGADNAQNGRDIMSANSDRSDLEKVVLPRLSRVAAAAKAGNKS